jgi:flavin reductase (DIM6/NTAB) family NADH-FMN oxidoreductase RutF
VPRDLNAIEAAMKAIDRELWIVSAADGARRGGLLATWVSSASIDRERPTMIVGIAPNHFSAELIDASGAVGLHLLRPDQVPLALNFTLGSGRTRDKWAGVDMRMGETGAPLLCDCAAWFEGRVFARLATGDRIFYWLDILAAACQGAAPPAREHDLFAAVTPEQKIALLADRDSDIGLQRPQHDAWRAALPVMLRPS